MPRARGRAPGTPRGSRQHGIASHARRCSPAGPRMHDSEQSPAAAQHRLASSPHVDLSTRRALGAALGAAFLAGAWTEGAMLRRGSQVLDGRPHCCALVARLAAYHRPPADRPRELGRVRRARAPGAPQRPAGAADPALLRLRARDGPDAVAGARDRVPGRARRAARARRRAARCGSPTRAGSSATRRRRRLRHYTTCGCAAPGAPPRPIARPSAG